MSLKQKPRDYQVEAAKWALGKERAVVCMPTGTGKTLVAILWIRELLARGFAEKILVLEPTRYLVEQVARYMREVGGLDARPLHGSLPRSVREAAWQAKVVVATPEIIVSEWERFSRERFQAVVVDECHHTTGQDPYKVIMSSYDFKYRLGLTAYIPPSRQREIEETIGEIRCWSWNDPRLAKYIPPWTAEVYEAELNPIERRLYDEIEKLLDQTHGKEHMVVEMALRWFVRDGALALRETVEKPTLTSKVLSHLHNLIFDERVRPAHKVEALTRVLRDHEGFRKCIVFIDRVVVAKYVAERFKDYGTVLILGRRHQHDVASILEKAHAPNTKLIVSTSAGEEGIDLPEADLLVVWSHSASPLRFIQRHGRMLRATGEKVHKWAIYIVTPDTIDIDNLLDSLLEARRAGVNVPLDENIFEYLWGLSRRRKLVDALVEPMDEELLRQYTGMPLERLREALNWLLSRSLIAYIYTFLGKTYFARDERLVDKLYERFGEYLKPSTSLNATVTVYSGSWRRSFRGTYQSIARRVKSVLASRKVIDRIFVSAFVEVSKGLVKMVRLSYSYPIAFWEEWLLDIVLRNAFSEKTLREKV